MNFKLSLSNLMILAAVLCAILCAPEARAQVGSLYGDKNIQNVFIKLMPAMFPDAGSGGELMFNFISLSDNYSTDEISTFYGVSLGGGGAGWYDSELGNLDERDFSVGYVLLLLDWKFFSDIEGPVRPYLGTSLGMGYGSYYIEQIEEEPEIYAGSSTVYGGGLEFGAHFKMGWRYWLTVSAGMDVRVMTMGGETQVSYPATATIGVGRWMGPL